MSPPRLLLLAALVPLLGTATLAGASCPPNLTEFVLSSDAEGDDPHSGTHKWLTPGQHLCLPDDGGPAGGGATPATSCHVCHRTWCEGSAAKMKMDSVDLRTVPVGPRRVTFDTTDPSVWSSKCMAAVKETTAYSVPSAPAIVSAKAGSDGSICIALRAPASYGIDCFGTENVLSQFQVRSTAAECGQSAGEAAAGRD